MGKLLTVSQVGVFVSDQATATRFFTTTMGLKVRARMPKMGYIALGPTLEGADASLNLWEPAAWGLPARQVTAMIGQPTGIGYCVKDFDATVAALRKKKVPVEVWGDGWGAFDDPDGNHYFLSGNGRLKSPPTKLGKLDFITVASRNRARLARFYTGTLGFTKAGGDEYASYRLQPNGTGLMPFTPKRSHYEDPALYQSDLAAIGERTYIMLRGRDLPALQQQLRKRKVRFAKEVAPAPWGGLEGEMLDPDGNIYQLVEDAPRTRARTR